MSLEKLIQVSLIMLQESETPTQEEVRDVVTRVGWAFNVDVAVRNAAFVAICERRQVEE